MINLFNEKSFLSILSKVCFVISALFTIMLFQEGIKNKTTIVLITAMAVIFEFAKYYLFINALTNNTYELIVRKIMFVFSILLFGVSILASLSFMQNEANRNYNESLKNSTEMKIFSENREKTKSLISTKQKEIDTLNSNLKSTEQSYNTQIENLNAINYISQAGVKETEKQEALKSIRNDISTKSKELTKLNESLNKKADIKINEKETSGNASVLHMIGKKLDIEETDMYFNFFLGILFECVALLLGLLGKGGSFTNLKSTSPTPIEKETQNVSRETFVEKDKNININGELTEDEQKYLDILLDAYNKGERKGINKIRSELGWGEYKAKQVLASLKSKKAVQCVGKNTFPTFN